MIDLSIVIVSWNVADVLSACVESIRTQRSHEIIVVDSASSDDTVQRIQQRYPHVNLLAQAENVGFTRGNNIGLAATQGRYLLLLNPDTVVVNDALDQMINHMEAHPQVGIVGPHTLNTDGTTQSSKRHFPTLITGFFESTWLQPYAPKAMMRHFYAEDVPDDSIAEVDWVQGSAMLVRRQVYEQIGGLDEGYVMFSEEVDWCKRAKDAGWRVVYYGKAQIIHHGGKSTEQASARKHIHFQESKLRYYRKYHGALAALVLRMFLLSSYLFQIALEGAKGLIGHKRALRLERVKTYWEVLRSGLAMQDTKAQRRKEFQS